MTGTRKVWKCLIKIGIFGLGMASTLAGYKDNSIPVTVCGAAAMLGSLMSSLITQLSRARALGAQNDHLRELEGQTAQTQVDVATVTSTTESLSPGDSLFLHHHAPTRDLYPPQSNMDRHNIIDPDFEDVRPLYSRPRLPIPPTSSSSLSLTGNPCEISRRFTEESPFQIDSDWRERSLETQADIRVEGPVVQKGAEHWELGAPLSSPLLLCPLRTPREYCPPRDVGFPSRYDHHQVDISHCNPPAYSAPVQLPKCQPSTSSLQSGTKSLKFGNPLSPSRCLRPLPTPQITVPRET
ncbi:hypothetical protein BDP27DRAFT_1430673 [Rhodocollybia butyracea]|uniref:Uncharacterized protein n=1 Tax=Rhodocollybia butyracea TaxID=206335 RepID=A0A9P5PAM1_9AGAR|nr:hypothetical protein BDP27DRAFT_1430673 [Rhodocollybia butyracea]